MTINTYVTFESETDIQVVVDKDKYHNVLGSQEKNIAVKLKELLTSVRTEVEDAIEQAGELEIEISGALEMKASGGVQYLLFNVGAEANKTNSMKVILRTTISPISAHHDFGEKLCENEVDN